jgi:hypothetical protein
MLCRFDVGYKPHSVQPLERGVGVRFTNHGLPCASFRRSTVQRVMFLPTNIKISVDSEFAVSGALS